MCVLVQVPEHAPAAGCVHLADGALHQAVLPLNNDTQAQMHRLCKEINTHMIVQNDAREIM